jgi:antirestriction protein ArdC
MLTMTNALKTRKSSTARKPARDAAAEAQAKVIAALKEGKAPWQTPYLGGGLPRSIATGKIYRGINTILLWIATQEGGWASPFFGTYKRLGELGGQVRKGEHGTMVIKWLVIRKDEEQADGTTKARSFMVPRVYTVFNVEQADWAEGIPAKYAAPVRERNPIEEAEAIIEGYKGQTGAPSFVSEDQEMAWYHPLRDAINVPKAENIVGMDEFYSTTFHEMVHSTGHQSRLAREGITDLMPGHRGSSYAFEELVAEFGAAMLCGVAGIDSTIANSGAYLRSWAAKLESSDSGTVLKAAGLAQKAVDRVLGVTWADEAASDEEAE